MTKAKIPESIYGKKYSEERKLNMNEGLGTSIYAYSFDIAKKLANTFFSC